MTKRKKIRIKRKESVKMPKTETLEIQKILQELGEKLGFISCMEEQIHNHVTYAPIYDVVWYLDLRKFFYMDSLAPMFENNKEWFKNVKKIPFAGFEVEGSTTSSKKQLSNFANLYSGDFIYNFVVVNNQAAGTENDTYRRGIKLNRYFLNNAGYRDTIFIDKIHLAKSIENLKCFDSDFYAENKGDAKRGTFGGETRSVDVYDKIFDFISKTGMDIQQNYSPDIYKIMFAMHKEIKTKDKFESFYLKNMFYVEPYEMEERISTKASDAYYIPKLDVVLGFVASKGFQEWLYLLSCEMKATIMDSPILFGLNKKLIKKLYIPLISIEIETTIGKHMNGGIFNMSKNSYLGILVTEENAESHLNYYKQELGIKNVIAYCTGGTK